MPENRLVHEQHAPVAESPKSPLKPQSQGEIKGTYKRTCARIHARVRYPRDVGSEAQFFVRANEGEFRLGPHCPDGRWGHPSRTPSGESALRWPHRPVPPQPRSREMSEFAWHLSDKYANFGKDTYQNLQIRIVSVQILIVSCLVNVGNLKMGVTTPKILTNRI